jgi:hypothetical protein
MHDRTGNLKNVLFVNCRLLVSAMPAALKGREKEREEVGGSFRGCRWDVVNFYLGVGIVSFSALGLALVPHLARLCGVR